MSTNDDDDLKNVLHEYRKKMAQSTRAFFTAKINALQEDTTLTDKKRLDILAPYFYCGKWPTSGKHQAVTEPAHLLDPRSHFAHIIDNDGIDSPADPEVRIRYLEELSDMVDEVAGRKVGLPAEFGQLLELTDGVGDNVYRDHEFPALGGTNGGAPPDRRDMTDRQPDLWFADQWDVLTGWRCGNVAHYGGSDATFMLYCRPRVESGAEEEYKWRAMTWENWDDDSPMWFDSIVEYLRYKAAWIDRLPEGWEAERMVLSDFHSEASESDEGEHTSDEESDEAYEEENVQVFFPSIGPTVRPEKHPDNEGWIWGDPNAGIDWNQATNPQIMTIEHCGSDLSTANPEDVLVKAIQAFELKQVWSNNEWLKSRISQYEKTTNTAEKANHLTNLARSFNFYSWEIFAERHNLSTPGDILSLETNIGQNDPGTRKPASPDVRAAFMDNLKTAINQSYDHSLPDYKPLELPTDYAALLNITNGIRDTDLRRSGLPGINPILSAEGISGPITGPKMERMAPEDVEKLPWADYLWRFGWVLSTGFLLGEGVPPERQWTPYSRAWVIYYYCARMEETEKGRKTRGSEIKEEQREWKWRVFHLEPGRSGLSVDEPEVFEGIVEWLEWYREWWDRESRVYPAQRAKTLKATAERTGMVYDEVGDRLLSFEEARKKGLVDEEEE